MRVAGGSLRLQTHLTLDFCHQLAQNLSNCSGSRDFELSNFLEDSRHAVQR